MLGQGFPHCPIFPTAASRRSLDRLSVPVWPITLSGRLPIVALVGRYPANQLIGRELTPNRLSPFTPIPCETVVLCGISRCFHLLSPCLGQIAHALLTRPPLEHLLLNVLARLACVKHAASVRPEPGSNSYVQSFSNSFSSSRRTSRQSGSSFLRPELKLSQNLTVLPSGDFKGSLKPRNPSPSATSLPSGKLPLFLLCIVFKVRVPPSPITLHGRPVSSGKSYYSKQRVRCQVFFSNSRISFSGGVEAGRDGSKTG